MSLAKRMSVAVLAVFAVIVGAACGDTPGGEAGNDAGPDGGGPGYLGLWRVTSETFDRDAGALTVSATSSQITDPGTGEQHIFRINGTVDIGAAELAFGQQLVVDDAIPLSRFPQLSNFIAGYTASGGDSGTFSFGGGIPTVGFVWTRPPSEKLAVQIDAVNAFELRRLTTTASDTLPVQGTITLGPGTPTFVSPHLSIAFLLRGGSFGIDPRDDQILDFGTSDHVSFNLDRSEGALGVQRIVFGTPNTAIAVGLLIVWDDVDGDEMPSPTLFDKCATVGADCLRGVSPIYLAYRSGSSPELTASPYGHLRSGWTQNVFIQDLRGSSARNGLVSLDPTSGVPFDIYVPPSPQQTFVPLFDF